MIIVSPPHTLDKKNYRAALVASSARAGSEIIASRFSKAPRKGVPPRARHRGRLSRACRFNAKGGARERGAAFPLFPTNNVKR